MKTMQNYTNYTEMLNNTINSGVFNDVSKYSVLSWLSKHKLATRAHVFIGTRCSYRCVFCYGNERRNLDFLSYNDIISYMNFLKEYGITDVEITGGEPTEFPDIYQLVQYASSLFDKVVIITNGSASVDTYKKLSEYVTEFLFSLHGYDEKSHIQITGNKDSWKNIHRAIQACSERIIRVNTTICKYNYKNLYEYAQHIVSLNIPNLKAINYLPMNSWDDAISIRDSSVPYYMYYNTLKDSILFLKNYIPDVIISIRYVPYCVVSKDLMKYVKTHIQHAIDTYDWAQELDGVHTRYDIIHNNRVQNVTEAILQKRKILYSKFKFCSDCSYRDICDGFQTNQLTREYPYIQEYMKNKG